MEFYVFKTSVQSPRDAHALVAGLRELEMAGRCNFDLDDCDRILRIESSRNISPAVIHFLDAKGFRCEELF